MVMGKLIPENDWKYIRKIKDDLLNSLCERINKQSVSLLKGYGSEHEKFIIRGKTIEN